jgi:hypothetical protein
VGYVEVSGGRNGGSRRMRKTSSNWSWESFLISSERFPSRRPRFILLKNSCGDEYGLVCDTMHAHFCQEESSDLAVGDFTTGASMIAHLLPNTVLRICG